MKTSFRGCVIGHPIGHSLSPFLHQRLFALQGRTAEYGFQDIAPEALPEQLPRLLREQDGLNVTIPHKQAVIPYLTRLSGRAQRYRSVNTIAVTPDGAVGYNTDADGFLSALRDGGVPLKGRVVLLGCGGVGRTFACEAALAGCTLVNAVREQDLPFAEELRAFVTSLVPKAEYTIVRMDEVDGDVDLLINATPVGMYPHTDALPVPEAVLSRTAAVFDAVYNPRVTRLLERAAACGAKTVGGMPMLVWQAVAAHAIWYDAVFSDATVRGVIEEALAYMEAHFR